MERAHSSLAVLFEGHVGRPDRRHEVAVLRHDQLARLQGEDLLEGPRDGRVPGHPALKEDMITDAFCPYNLLDVVLNDRVGKTADQILASIARFCERTSASGH